MRPLYQTCLHLHLSKLLRAIIFAALVGNSAAEANDGEQRRYVYGGKPVSREFYQAALLAKEAQTLEARNQISEAVTKLEQSLVLCPGYTEAEVNLGNLLIRLGRPLEAAARLKHAVENDKSGIEEGWLNLAGAQTACGQTSEALRTYRTFQSRFPGSKYRSKVEQLVTALKKEVAPGAASSPKVAESASINDYFSEATGGRARRWPSDRMPIKVFVKDGSGKAGYRPQFARMLKDGFAQWEGRSNGKVSFAFVPDPSQAGIICDWIDDPAVTSGSVKRGETKLRWNKDAIVEARINILLGPSANRVSDEKIAHTCLHEVGHALGLQGHSPDPKDVMFFAVINADAPGCLSSRDINTLMRLYDNDYFVVKDISAQHEEAVSALEKKDYSRAVDLFLAVLRSRPDLEEARINLALCYAGAALEFDRAKQYESAENAYKAALEIRKSLRQPEILNSAVQNYISMLRDTGRLTEAGQLSEMLGADLSNEKK